MRANGKHKDRMDIYIRILYSVPSSAVKDPSNHTPSKLCNRWLSKLQLKSNYDRSPPQHSTHAEEEEGKHLENKREDTHTMDFRLGGFNPLTLETKLAESR